MNRNSLRNIRRLGKRVLRGRGVSDETAAIDSQSQPPVSLASELPELFLQTVHAAARSLATRGDHRRISPVNSPAKGEVERRLRIGLFGNLANQAFISARSLRRLGHDVELVVQNNNIDAFLMNRPVWEEREIEITGSDHSQIDQLDYNVPDFVRVVPYDLDAQIKFQGRFSAVQEVLDLYREATGQVIPRDIALLLAQWMGHFDYIKAMHDYDVVYLSMWPVCLGVFCSKPYVVAPLGGELYITAFEEDVQGLMCRASFRGASHIAVPETDYPAYLDRLGATAPRTFLPLIVDTDIYEEGREEEIRAEWQAKIGGDRFLLSVCRQSWEWKGSDRLIRAFAQIHQKGGSSWRLVLQSWGDDLERSRALVHELGLDDVTLWLSLCSKPLLRRRQRAADVVADQFVMEGYGASVLESLAAGKPVIMAPVPASSAHYFSAGPPPLVGAKSEEEIVSALLKLLDEPTRESIGRGSRAWIEQEHGYRNLSPRYLDMFEIAAGRRRP